MFLKVVETILAMQKFKKPIKAVIGLSKSGLLALCATNLRVVQHSIKTNIMAVHSTISLGIAIDSYTVVFFIEGLFYV